METLVDATLVSTTIRQGAQELRHLTFTQTKARKRTGSQARKTTVRNSEHLVESLSASSSDNHSKTKDRLGFKVNAAKAYHTTPPPNTTTIDVPFQEIVDRPPPTPPPFPEDVQPWYMVYAAQVAWTKLDKKESLELKQDIDHISESSQARTSASKATQTSTGLLSQTPSKNRMRMTLPGQRERSRSRIASRGLEESDGREPDARRSSSPVTSEASVEVTSSSSSESDSDREETDGTDDEGEEILEFKRATRNFADIRYPGARTSTSTPIVISTKKRKLLLEDVLPDTFGPKHASKLSRIMIEGSKPGLGPRAVARKSFAKAIGSRLLAKKRQEGQ